MLSIRFYASALRRAVHSRMIIKMLHAPYTNAYTGMIPSLMVQKGLTLDIKIETPAVNFMLSKGLRLRYKDTVGAPHVSEGHGTLEYTSVSSSPC